LTPEQLFADLLAARPAQPFVTYYDEESGERSELSAKSLANWVAKTHHLLVDELGLGVGNRAMLSVPAHWISVPILLGSLTAGLCLVTEAGADVDVAFTDTRAAAATVQAGVPDVYVIDPAAAAAGFGAAPPGGAADYVTSVRPQADVWAGVRLLAADADPCLALATVSGTAERTRAEVTELARARAAELSMTPGARVLTTRTWHDAQDWIDTVLAPVSVGGSIVFVRNCLDEDVVARRLNQERADLRV
jgi:uncharacterized protein (TIGR03089 family)